jgi:hypothetical protein
VRFAVGAALALIAGRLALRASRASTSPRWAESLLIVGLTVANPTLWVTALSLLVAIVPLWRTPAMTQAEMRVAPEVIAT